MAISDRIQSIEEHIKESYQELEGIGIDTTEVDKNLENIPKLIDGYWETLPKVTGEGTSITLDNTKEGKMKIDLKGNTSQETTTGKNKYNATRSSATTNAVTYSGDTSNIYINGTPNNTGRIFFNKTYLEAGTYTFSATLSKGSFTNDGNNLTYLYLYKGTETTASWDFDTRILLTATIGNVVSATFTISEGSYYYLSWYLDTNYTWTNAEIKYQVETGNSFTSFEPYTNGASPNPQYPQAIHVVSGDNTINICGKNLFDDSIVTNLWSNYSTQEIIFLSGANLHKFDCKQGDIFTLSATFESAGGNGAILIQFFDKNGNNLGRSAVSNNTTLTLTRTAPLNTSYAYIGRYYATPLTIQLEKSNQATTYEAYKGISYPISLGVKNLWNREDVKEGFLPQSGSYPVSNPTYPNSKYVIVPLMKGQKLTLSGSTSSTGRVRCIDKDTNQVVNSFTTVETEYYITTHAFGDGFYEATITARKDFLVGIMDYISFNLDLVVNYGATPQYVSDNPIELCKIGDYQDKIDKSSGKNLLDYSTCVIGDINGSTGQEETQTMRIRSDFIKIEPSTSYVCSLVGGQYTTFFYTKNKTYIAGGGASWINSGTSFTTPSNAKYVRLKFWKGQNTAIALTDLKNVMFNIGTTALPYEPYGKDWYLNKQISKVAFSDLVFNEIGGNFSQFSTNGNIAMVYLQNDLKVTGNRDDVFCNLLKPYSSSLFGGLQTGINQYYNATKLLLSVPLANVEEFAGETLTVNNYLSYTQNYIKGLEGYIYYILATPTYTEITDSTLLSQLEALNGAKSYTTQTNISQENNDNASILNATALSE